MISSLGSSTYALGDLAARVPELHEIVRTVGARRRRRRTNRMAREAGWLGLGLVLGAGLATLLTPISGAEFRKRLSERAIRLRNSIATRIRGIPTPTRTAKRKSRKIRTNESRQVDAS
jgi:hypothetical protein